MARVVSLNRGLIGLALLLLALGLWQLGGAALIHGKAWLAQRLLDRAWAATLAGGHEVKPWPWADTWPVARLQVDTLDANCDKHGLVEFKMGDVRQGIVHASARNRARPCRA